jgi:hypothetical protein
MNGSKITPKVEMSCILFQVWFYFHSSIIDWRKLHFYVVFILAQYGIEIKIFNRHCLERHLIQLNWGKQWKHNACKIKNKLYVSFHLIHFLPLSSTSTLIQNPHANGVCKVLRWTFKETNMYCFSLVLWVFVLSCFYLSASVWP